MNKRWLVIVWFLAVWASFNAQAAISVIPRPLSLVEGKGAYALKGRSLQEVVKTSVDPSLDAEAYDLTVTRRGIALRGGSDAGLFYGFQTLRQLEKDGAIPAVRICDKPAFPYRGAMLDVSRHFFPVEDVKTFIDILALHKLNRFHWHLTDDQGWRIEIKAYPQLTRIGSVRKETLVGRMTAENQTYDGTPYGGYYTQEEVREIVRYAAERHIEVIPEIEMPGHGLGALTAYPWLGCTGGPYELWTRWGISKDVYCAGKETTFEFIETVLGEIMDLFPSQYIHVGGDECPKDRWKACPLCQQRKESLGLKDEHQLQSWFMNRVEQIVAARGRRIIGWDEILQDGLSKTVTIMAWSDQTRGTKAAQVGNDVIMTPKWNCYLDYSQTSDYTQEPTTQTRYLPVRQVYRLDPLDRLKPAEWPHVLGVQANLWTEYIPDLRDAEFRLLPRLAALAEVAWSYGHKDYEDFVTRAKELLPGLYERLGYRYAPYLFEDVE